MKKRSFFQSALMLAGLICLTANSAEARHTSKRFRHHSYSARSHPVSLANTRIRNIQFGYNSYNVPAANRPDLDKVVKLMKANNASVKVSGYADNKGGYVYNWKLSEKRAKAVKIYMVGRGADSTRIAETEYGYTHPIASNKTPEGRAKNRRAEIYFQQ